MGAVKHDLSLMSVQIPVKDFHRVRKSGNLDAVYLYWYVNC